MHNIGMLFVQMGRLEEAANSFEWVMRERAEFKAGLHAILCHFALSHRDKMKRDFLELLEVQLNIDQEDKYSMSTVGRSRYNFNRILAIYQNSNVNEFVYGTTQLNIHFSYFS